MRSRAEVTPDKPVIGRIGGPVRTCIGCRQRASTAVLCRVVAVPTTDPGRPAQVVVDSGRRLPGRGAWLHQSPACVGQAIRRRAFARALRVPGHVDITEVAKVTEVWAHRE